MKLPNEPVHGQPLLPWARDLLRYLRATRITGIPGYLLKESPNGTVAEPVTSQPIITADQRLPFQISATKVSSGGSVVPALRAEAGLFGTDTFAALIEPSPDDGDWFLQAQITINATTGAITASDVYWSPTEDTDTSTDFYLTIAKITVTAGKPDPASIEQYSYGPITAYVHGGATEVWEVTMV